MAKAAEVPDQTDGRARIAAAIEVSFPQDNHRWLPTLIGKTWSRSRRNTVEDRGSASAGGYHVPDRQLVIKGSWANRSGQRCVLHVIEFIS